jgi:hypothetical protein
VDEGLPRVSVVSARGALVGAAGGAIFGIFSGGAYFASNANELSGKIAWHVIAPAYLACAVVSGVLVAGGAATGVAFFDRFVGARVWSAPIPSATIGGALGCMLPGGVGGGYFAAQHMPFMGGLGMFAVPVMATIVIAIALAVHDRMLAGRTPRPGAAVVIALALALLFGGLVVCGVHWLGDERMLVRYREAATFLTPLPTDPEIPSWQRGHTGLIVIGLVSGIGLGTLLGIYVGGVMAWTRRLA